MALYELAIMGAPSDPQIEELKEYISEIIENFGLHLGQEVALAIRPSEFNPPQRTPAAVVFFGGAGVSTEGLDTILLRGLPVLPVASAGNQITTEIPEQIKALNCLTCAEVGLQRITTALLECACLLPRQRRVFVSYRRGDVREAALQLFNALSARFFDVFLDTHGIPPAEDFQAVLWHRLCDSDVLVMLDTAGYFEGRWTNAEFGRALAKGISVLRVGWPNVIPSPRTDTVSRVELEDNEVAPVSGMLAEGAIERICTQLEFVRAQSYAVRRVNLLSKLRQGVEAIGGRVVAVGVHNAAHLVLPDGKEIVAYPSVGVPTALTLNDAVDYRPGRSVAVVYDHVGLHHKWLEHLAWLGENVQAGRWIKASEAGWTLAGWEVS
jgi:TIR domain